MTFPVSMGVVRLITIDPFQQVVDPEL
jgi:hypothetical protein